MITVDVVGDEVAVQLGDAQEKLSMLQASVLIGDLAAALQLAAEVLTPPPSRQPQWRYRKAGEYYAILRDGRQLQVRRTDAGWIGEINGSEVNPGMPLVRKRDVQQLVISQLGD